MDNHNNLKPNLRAYAHLFDKLSSGKPIWRIGIYVRLSKEDKNSVSLSIVNQIKIQAQEIRSIHWVNTVRWCLWKKHK